MNIKLLAATAALATLGLAAPAMADHDWDDDWSDDWSDDDRRRVVTTSGYARGAVHGQYDYARVLSSEPIIRYVNVKTPVRECWDDVEYYTVDRRAPGSGASTLVGAIVGGVIGHQFGSGRGNDAATVAGTLIGAAIGNDSAQRRHGHETVEYSRPVQRCATRVRHQREERIDGYRVVYLYNGQKYATRMPYDPGRQIRVRVDIRPAG